MKKGRKHELYKTYGSELPHSYRHNTHREETLLQYIEHFRRQFEFLHPSPFEYSNCPYFFTEKKPLFLTALNEAGVQKSVW